MNGPLAALEAIDWTGVTDFYGPVDELPGLLRATLSQDDAERLEALKEAGNQLYHQSGVCEASVHVVPFLARAALSAPQDRWWFLSWIVDSCGPQQDAEQDDTGLVGRVKDAVLVELPALLGLLADPDPRLRRETLKLIAAFPYATTAGLVDITTLSDPDPSARADLITVVADLRQDWPGVIDYLDRALADEDVGVRYQAARLLMIFSGTPYPAHLLDTVADALAERGRFPNDSSSINRFCGVPGYTERSPRGVNGLRADPLVQDPDAAAYAARRILGSASPHADYAMLLAKEIEILWRGREREATALVLDALTAVSEPREQYLTLRCIVRMLAGTEDRDRDLLGRLEAWGERPEPDIASTAWAASAWIDRRSILDRLRSGADSLTRVPPETFRELCEVCGPDAECLIVELRRRLETMPLKADARYAEALLTSVLGLGDRAVEFLPLLFVMLERDQALYPLLETLAALGPAALDAAGQVEVIARTHRLPRLRLLAARTHRALTGEHTLARQVAADVAAAGKLDYRAIAEAGLLGPDALACTGLLEEEIARRRFDGAGLALWRITGDGGRFAPVFARLARHELSMISAIEGLIEIGTCPDECRDLVTGYAESPRRILDTTRHHSLRRDDYLLQSMARELLRGSPALGSTAAG